MGLPQDMDRFLKIISLLIFISARCEASQQCYSCRYSNNEGCDLAVDTSRISSTITCSNDCYTQITRSSDGSDYEVIRGCNTSPVCNDVSYSVGDQAYMVQCCSGDRCNDDLSKKVFECMQCSDTDGKSSTCPDHGFWDTKKSSIDTVYCASYCKKEVRIDSDTTVVTRSCVDACEEDNYSAFGIATYTFCCRDIDACNTASGITLTLWSMGFSVIISLVLAVIW